MYNKFHHFKVPSFMKDNENFDEFYYSCFQQYFSIDTVMAKRTLTQNNFSPKICHKIIVLDLVCRGLKKVLHY